jgi:L-alanine-DL-glutamate epimerase-like enolase superfamily enzyme
LKITGLRTIALSYPFACPLGTPYSDKGRMGALAVFLDTDQGLSGEGVLLAVHDKRIGVHAAMVQSLAEIVVGRDPTMSEAILQAMREDVDHLGPSGVTAMAIGAVDSCLLDLRAKLVGLPVHRLLGAARDRVPAYYSSGLWRHVPLDKLLDTAHNIVAHGYKAFKLRASPGDHKTTIERVRRVREAVGDDVTIMLDLGTRFSTVDAIRLGRDLEPYNLGWIEEPIPSEDHAGEAQISAALDTPIAAGEGVFTLDEFAHMIETRCVDVLMPDICRIGGPRQFLRVGAMAEAAHIPVSGHVLPEHSLALMASLPNGTFLEVMPWSQPLFADEIRIEKGFAVLPDTPGWGLSLDPAALKKYAVG